MVEIDYIQGYEPLALGTPVINVKIVSLLVPKSEVEWTALLDTGAVCSAFPKRVMEYLGGRIAPVGY